MQAKRVIEKSSDPESQKRVCLLVSKRWTGGRSHRLSETSNQPATLVLLSQTTHQKKKKSSPSDFVSCLLFMHVIMCFRSTSDCLIVLLHIYFGKRKKERKQTTKTKTKEQTGELCASHSLQATANDTQ